MSWLSVTTSIYTFAMIAITRSVMLIYAHIYTFDLFRFIMHNYPTFYEEHFKSGNIVSTLSILSCWMLGLIQAVPLMSTWKQSCKMSNFYTEKKPAFYPHFSCSLIFHTDRPQRWSNFEHDGMVNGFCQSTIVVDGFSMVFVQLDHCH